jgi:3-O-methylgallate 3,4-dioxygenase
VAEIVLGLASSHAPQLEIPPDRWRSFGDRNRDQAEHWFNGAIYSFGELVELRASEHLDKELSEETFAARFNACQQAIAHLGKTLVDAKADVCIVLGDDQMESFNEENMPAFCIYYGDTVLDSGSAGGFRGKYASDEYANRPSGPTDHPADAAFGEHLISSMVRNEFDVARSSKLPAGRGEGAIGHAFYYVYRRLMNNKATPTIPVLVNTYYPPNAPTANRCYNFGVSLRKAVEDWDTDQRVAIFASGGLSHTVIEEELDEKIIDGLVHDDVAKLTDYPDERFRGGTSEIKNWIALAGAMSGTGLNMDMVDYVPCYRTEAGNGTAMGFAEWA